MKMHNTELLAKLCSKVSSLLPLRNYLSNSMCELDETAVPPCKVTIINGITPWRVMSHAGSTQMGNSKAEQSDANKKKTMCYVGL